MTVTLYKNLSEHNVVDKTLQQLTSLTGTLREGSSVTNPTIKIESDATIQNVNYIYINEFSRFYFVGDILNIRNNLWELSCHVDVLSTYKMQLRLLSAVIARQENNYNLYLEDDRLLTTCRRIYTTLAFPTRVNSAKTNPDAPSFILTVAGGEDTTPTESEET